MSKRHFGHSYIGSLAVVWLLVSPTMAGARTWRSLGPYGAQVIAIRPSPHPGGEVWALTAAGAFRSEDSGESWHRRNPPDHLPPIDLAFDAADPETLLVVTGDAAWRTRDGGATWLDASGDLHFESLDNFQLIGDRRISGRFYLVAQSRRPDLFVTDDAGESWQLLRGGVLALATDDNGALVVIRESRRVERSESAGHEWRPLGRVPGDQWYTGLAIGADGWIYGVGLDTLVASGDGGATWTALQWPIEGPDFRLVVHPTEPLRLFCAAYEGIYRSSDRGATWARLSAEVGREGVTAVAVGPHSPSRIYAGSYGRPQGDLLVSDDGGDTWHASSQGLNALLVGPAVEVDGVLLANVFRSELARSDDGGASWSSIEWDVPAFEAMYFTSALHADGSPGVVLAVIQGVYRSVDAGLSWQPTQAAEACPELQVASNSSAQAGRHVAVAMFKTLCVSSDEGLSWREVPVRSFAEVLLQVAIDPGDPRHLLVQGCRGDHGPENDGRCFWLESANQGRRWKRIRLPPEASYPVIDTAGRIYAYRGAYSFPLGGLWERSGRGWELRDPRVFEDLVAVGERLYGIVNGCQDGCRRVEWSDDGGRTWVRIPGVLDDRIPVYPYNFFKPVAFADVVVAGREHHVLLRSGVGLLVATVAAP